MALLPSLNVNLNLALSINPILTPNLMKNQVLNLTLYLTSPNLKNNTNTILSCNPNLPVTLIMISYFYSNDNLRNIANTVQSSKTILGITLTLTLHLPQILTLDKDSTIPSPRLAIILIPNLTLH